MSKNDTIKINKDVKKIRKMREDLQEELREIESAAELKKLEIRNMNFMEKELIK